MSRYHSYLQTASRLISTYPGTEPLAAHLKRYFSNEKKIGSTDRKMISHLCYCYYRVFHCFEKKPIPLSDQILRSVFLCSFSPHPLLEALCPEWNAQVHVPLAEKWAILGITNGLTRLFPFKDHLGKGIDPEHFSRSFLHQPLLFIRARPGYEKEVESRLRENGLSVTRKSNNCFALPQNTRLERWFKINRELVIQDYSSQRVAALLAKAQPLLPPAPSVWDCCAASGGKSILAKDVLGNMDLTVSDVRSSMLHQLRKRLEEAGIKGYHALTADLTQQNPPLPNKYYHLIIADVPCSGSGTWGRTPEQLYNFQIPQLYHYTQLQRRILETIIPSIRRGGWLLYITCSVFKEENEEQTTWLQTQGLEEIQETYCTGYQDQADTLYACLMRKA